MANERQWNAVPPVLLTANGTTEGVLRVTDTAGFYFDMQASLQNNTPFQLTVYIKNVVNSTTLWVGAKKGGLDHNIDVSAFTVATASTISATMQNKSTVPNEARLQATYETDPVDAWRTIPVDSYGNHYTESNPLPVSFEGGVSIANVGIIGPAPDDNRLDVNTDGSINVNLEGLSTFQTEQYSIGVSPVQITPTPMIDRSSIGFKAICTTSTDAIYIGNSSSVTISTGYPLFTHDTLEMDLTGADTIYAIGTSAGQTLCVIELGD